MANIGFIGLGHMGNPMVKNLLRAGHRVSVFDINEQAMQSLAIEGALPVSNAGDVAIDADVVFTMLQTGEQVKGVCLGDNGIFANIPDDSLYLDTSSIDINESREIHRIAADHNIAMLDAPVSGGAGGAANATLTFMVGGKAHSLEKAHPYLEQLGQRIVHCGSEGNGQAAKICNNMILGISMIAVSEAFLLGEKLGLSADKLFEVTSNSSGSCWSLTANCPIPDLVPTSPSTHHYQAGFSAYMMLKDLRNSQLAAESSQATTPLGQKATELYESFNSTNNNAELDFCAIVNMLRKD